MRSNEKFESSTVAKRAASGRRDGGGLIFRSTGFANPIARNGEGVFAFYD
jgi:hypothetical protein